MWEGPIQGPRTQHNSLYGDQFRTAAVFTKLGAPQTPGNGDLSLLKNKIFLSNHSVKKKKIKYIF